MKEMDSEIERMFGLVEENVNAAFSGMTGGSSDDFDAIYYREDYIDYLNSEISRYIAKVSALDMSEEDSKRIGAYYKIIGNLERIGDHAMNIAEYARTIENIESGLTTYAITEVRAMQKLTQGAMDAIRGGSAKKGIEMLKETAQYEQRIDDLSDQLRNNQLDRMRQGTCSAEVSVLFTEMITDFERMGDHALNIAEEYSSLNN